VVLGQTSALSRADAAAALLTKGFETPGVPAMQASTLAALPYYGLRGVGPADMREAICGRKPPATQSEAGAEHEEVAAPSPWLVKLVNPQLVTVALGGATGPIPAAMRDENGQEYADVPIPTPRPDYAPVAKAAAQGDAGTN
jgi:D-alanyl-D-alanine carboxypeptidase